MSLALRTTMIGTTVGMLLLAAQATAAAEQDAAKGQAVYTAQKCSVCHSIEGKGNKNESARRRGLEVVGRRYPEVDHQSHRDDEEDEVHEEAADGEPSTTSCPPQTSTRWWPTCRA